MAAHQQVEQSLFNFDERDVEKLNLDTFHLTNISNFFPQLVWQEIVDKLNAKDDVESCSNSSLYFRNLLTKNREPQVVVEAFEFLSLYLIEDEHDEASTAENSEADPQVEVLGPLVELPDIENGLHDLQIHEAVNVDNLVIGNENLEPGGENPNDEDNLEIEIQEDKDNSMKELLKCRLVSQSWNSAIENLFPHKEVGHYILKFDMSSFKYMQLDPCSNEIFMSFRPPQDFMEHFDQTHYNVQENKVIKNPLIGRSVQFMEVQIYSQQEDEYFFYLEGILEFLRKYGSEIWYVFFDFQSSLFDNDPVVMYQQLQQFLTLLPNLKILRVSFQDIHPPHTDLLQHDFMRNHIFGMLHEAVLQNPIPISPKLEFMCLTNLPTPILHELIAMNRNIVQLQVQRKAYHGDYGLFWVPFPNLTALNLQIASVEQFESFENGQFAIQLEKVYLWYEESAPFISWSRIFHALESKFGDNCKELLIQMPLPKTDEEKMQVLEESHLFRMNLSKLERITFFDDTPFCLDFLLPSKNTLEDILIRYTNDDNENAVAQHLENQQFVGCRQDIQFVGFKEKMEESNIWKEFPKLGGLALHRSSEMGECVTYSAGLKENVGMEMKKVHKQIWSRVTRQNID